MRKLLVTGGAGFIGANFVHYWLANHPADRVVVLDALTYAGNIETLKPLMGNPNFRFVKGNICNNELVELLLQTAPQVASNSAQLDEGEVLAAAAMATGQVATNQADDLWAAALAEATPAPAAPATAAEAPAAHPKLQGPVVDPSAHDVVTSQSQVDDLLASLGF